VQPPEHPQQVLAPLALGRPEGLGCGSTSTRAHTYLHQDVAHRLQLATDNMFQLRHFDASRIKQRDLGADFLHRDPGPERVEAKGHQCVLGLAQEVPDFLRLARTDSSEVL
jgi:hypothetical protein